MHPPLSLVPLVSGKSDTSHDRGFPARRFIKFRFYHIQGWNAPSIDAFLIYLYTHPRKGNPVETRLPQKLPAGRLRDFFDRRLPRPREAGPFRKLFRRKGKWQPLTTVLRFMTLFALLVSILSGRESSPAFETHRGTFGTLSLLFPT